MIKQAVSVINDFSGGQDTKTPIISMGLNKSPNMRNFHCAGVGNRLLKRGGFAKVNSTAITSDLLDEFYPPGYQTYDYPLRDDAERTQISQGFKCNTSSTVTKIKLWLKKTGTPAGTDTVTLVIQTNSSGVPSGSAVTNGTSNTVDISDIITTSYAWVEFTFTTNPSLTSGTQYHLVLQGAFTISSSNYVIWGADNYDVVYQNGSMSKYDGASWTANTSYNAIFEIYITGGARGDDGYALWDFSSKSMLLGVFGQSVYKMDKNSAGTPDGTWDLLSGFGESIDVQQLVANATSAVYGGTAGSGETSQKLAQSFQATGAISCTKISSRLSVYASPTDNITLRIETNNAGAPSGTLVNASATKTLDASTVSSGYVDFIFPATISLAASTTYWIVMQRSGARDTTNYIGWLVNTTSVYANGNQSRMDNTAWVDVPGNDHSFKIWKNPTFSWGASRYYTFADWQSGRALINTDTGLFTYTGTGDISTVSAAPIGKFVVIWRNYVFIAGIRGLPNTVRYSDLSDYTTWTAANTLNFDTNNSDVITGMRILKDKLYIFKRYSIHRISFLGSSPTFQIDPILGTGCPSHYTIKEVNMGGDVGSVLIFLTTDKNLAVFDGYNVQIISDSLTEETNDLFAASDDQPKTFADMNFTYIDLFHSAVKTDTYEYILYCVLDSDTSVNYAFVFDYKTGGIYPYDGQIFTSSCYALSTSKTKLLYCAGYSGFMWLQESGNSDDGSAINAYWVSGKIKSSAVSLINKALQLGIPLKEASSGSTLNLNFQYRLDWNTTWTTAETVNYDRNDAFAFGKTGLFEIGSIENMLQVKLKDNSTNPAVTIYGVELYGEPLGVEASDRATS